MNDVQVATRQEEIREGVARNAYLWKSLMFDNLNTIEPFESLGEKEKKPYYTLAHQLGLYLKEEGVVIKVDRGHDSDCAVHNMPAAPNDPCDCAVLPQGCVAVESLVAGKPMESASKGIDGKPYIVGMSGVASAVEPLIKVDNGSKD